MASPASIAANSNKTGFLDLPPEIRNTIYELALTPTPSIEISRITNDQFRKCPKSCACRDKFLNKSLTLQRARARQHNGSIHLLRACKVVRSEATPVIYGANQFEFVFDCHFVAFIDMIGDSASYLRHIYFGTFESKSMFNSTFVRLRKCKRLQKIRVTEDSLMKLYITGSMLATRLEPFLKALKAAKALRGEHFSPDDMVEIHSSQDSDPDLAEASEILARMARIDLKHELEKLIS